MDLLIRNGVVVNSDAIIEADVAVQDGKILSLDPTHKPTKNTYIIDAKGLYVFPGGIDPHVHLFLPTPAGNTGDDFYSGSKAALYGATTSLIDFVTPRKGQNLLEALNERKKEASNSLIDYSFHVSPVDWHPGIEEEIRQVIEAGVSSFKVYLAYKDTIGIDDSTLHKVMQTAANKGGIVTVHAEDGDEVNRLRNEFAASGQLSPEFHLLSRPNIVEAEAVERVILHSEETGCKVYIVHVSTHESVRLIEKAQKRGVTIYGETCPQYLVLNDSVVKGSFNETAKYVFSPPLRKKGDNDALWKALKKGVIQTIGTDHCPFFLEQKAYGKDDFRKIPNGAGGIEHRMSILYTYGVMTGKISLQEFVALTSTNAAKIFGMYPRKGKIAVGSDADIVLWDPKPESVISAQTHRQNSDLNIYEGMNVFGAPRYVISKGRVVLHKNVLNLDNCKAELLNRTIQ
jgi:dihydropyrimidinase